jgi:hypothetical protein
MYVDLLVAAMTASHSWPVAYSLTDAYTVTFHFMDV